MTNEDYKILLANAQTIFSLIGLLLQDNSIKYTCKAILRNQWSKP